MPFDHILFPTDFSARSHAMIPTVEDLARRFSARVTILHVFESPLYAEIAYEMLEMDAIRRVAGRQLEAFAAGGFSGCTVTRVMREGRSAGMIVEAAAEGKANLITMPTAGYTRFRELLLGSVTTSVLHDTETPVFTSAHTEDVMLETPDYQRILCAVDLSPASVAVLRQARELATHWGSTLTVVHAVPAVNEIFASGASDSAHRYLCEKARAEYPVIAAAAQVSEPLEIVEEPGSTADGIVAAVGHAQASLVVAGRGQARGVLGRLRTNIHELIRKSPVPVISV